jgi:hypothetical protein
VEASILKSVKKILGIEASYTAFDLDILIHINSVFSTLHQLGIGPDNGFAIEDDTATWAAFIGVDPRLSSVKTYVYLKVRMLFDPPQTSYLIESLNQQAKELEWRLNVHREQTAWVDPFAEEEELPVDLVLDGGSP